MSEREMRARRAILTRLRSATADAEGLFRSREPAAASSKAPGSVTVVESSGTALVKAFGEKLREALGSYEIVDNAADLAERIVAQIDLWLRQEDGRTLNSGELLSWAPNELPVPDLGGRLAQHGISLFIPDDLTDEDQRVRAATLTVGITGVDAAFAGTGSLLLVPGRGKSRAASLLPLHHIALVPISKIHPTFESWLAGLRRTGELEPLMRDNAQLVFITGPSKSADIELNLTLGVHGPRAVHAIVFDDGR